MWSREGDIHAKLKAYFEGRQAEADALYAEAENA